jgi:hypothetical protein
MYFVYRENDVVYTSPITTENSVTYTPTEAGAAPYYLRGFVSDGEQTADFESDRFMVEYEGWPHIVSAVPDRMVAYPGQTITWTVIIDYGTETNGQTGGISYVLTGETTGVVDARAWGDSTTYSFAPTEPDVYHLQVALMCSSWFLGANAPAVRVAEP